MKVIALKDDLCWKYLADRANGRKWVFALENASMFKDFKAALNFMCSFSVDRNAVIIDLTEAQHEVKLGVNRFITDRLLPNGTNRPGPPFDRWSS